MNTRFVEAFLCVVRLGSFRAAAQKLYVSQAAISSRISALEQELGARLFDRDARDLRLTPVGLRLLSYGERMLELQREMIAIGQGDAKLLGLVRIGAVETVVHTWLVDFIHELQSSYPSIEVQLSCESTERLHRSLRGGEIDIALQTDAVVGDGIVNTHCLPMSLRWVGPPATDRHGTEPLPSLLEGSVVTLTAGSQPHIALKELYWQAGLPFGRVHCVGSIAAIVRLVRSGFANALMPPAAVRDDIEAGLLRIIACDVSLPNQRFVISYRDNQAAEAIGIVAALACGAADSFSQSLSPPYAPD